jgi:hypothetical protein
MEMWSFLPLTGQDIAPDPTFFKARI